MPASEHAQRTIFSVFCGDPKGVRNGHKLRERRGGMGQRASRAVACGQADGYGCRAHRRGDRGRGQKRETRVGEPNGCVLVHLLKWKFQPERRGSSWQRTIKEQRNAIALHLEETPSLKAFLSNPKWRAATWADTVTKAINETGLDQFPNVCPWDMDQVLSAEFYPD